MIRGSGAAALLKRKDVFGWCLYDWANSAFVTSVTTVILPVYFLTLTPNGSGPVTIRWAGVSLETHGDALWSYLTGAYMLAAGLASPILGAIADQARAKKRMLGVCVVIGSALTCGLVLATAERYLLCGLLFAGAAFLWTCGNLFYDGLLTDLSDDPGELDAISTAGYAVGYLGGGLLLAVNLGMVSWPERFGLTDAGAATRIVFPMVGLWWLLFSIPLLFHVRERRVQRAEPSSRAQRAATAHLLPAFVASWFRGSVARPVRGALGQLLTTLRRVRHYRQLFRMLLSFVFYNTGVGTVITIAALYGKAELNISDRSLISCILMIQFIGFPASFGFVALADRLGARNGIFIGLAVYVIVVVYAFRMTSAAQFWGLGVLVGMVQGGTQALSRSLYGSMIPPGQAGEFFGFFSIFNKIGSFAGPLCFGIVRDATHSSRLAILFIGLFFLIGAALLATVDVEDARRAAGRASDTDS